MLITPTKKDQDLLLLNNKDNTNENNLKLSLNLSKTTKPKAESKWMSKAVRKDQSTCLQADPQVNPPRNPKTTKQPKWIKILKNLHKFQKIIVCVHSQNNWIQKILKICHNRQRHHQQRYQHYKKPIKTPHRLLKLPSLLHQ